MRTKPILIFDLDGTLFDSNGQIFEAVNSVRSDFGKPLISVIELTKHIGLPAQNLFDDLELNESEIDEIVIAFRENLRTKIALGNIVFANVTRFVNLVVDLGFIACIATSKPQDLAELVIAGSEIAEKFSVIAGTGTLRPKPFPDVIQKCLYESGGRFGIMFGDRIEDIQAAISANIASIGIAQGVHSESDLLNAGANLVFPNFEKVLSECLSFPGGPDAYFQELC
jgi:phosphoglycolate phosphatase